jgi:hypothetical protein
MKCYTLWVCVCSLRYTARKVHALYFIVFCGLSGQTSFFWRTSQTARCLQKSYWTFWSTFWIVSPTFVWNNPHFKKNSTRYHKCIHIFLSDFNDTLIFSTDFQKTFKYHVSWKSLSWELSYYVWMDKQDDLTQTDRKNLMYCSPCILRKLVDSKQLDALNFSNIFICLSLSTCFGHYVPIIRRDPIALTQLLYLSFRFSCVPCEHWVLTRYTAKTEWQVQKLC